MGHLERTGPEQRVNDMSDTKELAVRQHRWRMLPSSLGEAMEMAQIIAGSELCPKQYRGRPQDCIVAYEYGAALGLSWMQSLRSVSVINGQGALWGDAIPALIHGSGECERFHEYFEGQEGADGFTAVCIIKRKGLQDEVRRTFSVSDAKTAKLWQKRGRDGQDTPWITYPKRMLQMRGRGFAARDSFADKLAGLAIAEEAMDSPNSETTIEEIQVSTGLTIFERLSEAIRDNVEKAFATLNIPGGARLAKLNEYFRAETDPEESAQALLDWCRDEFAKRKTGQPRKRKGADNGKAALVPSTSVPPAPPAPAADPPVAENAAPAKEAPKGKAVVEEALF